MSDWKVLKDSLLAEIDREAERKYSANLMRKTVEYIVSHYRKGYSGLDTYTYDEDTYTYDEKDTG